MICRSPADPGICRSPAEVYLGICCSPAEVYHVICRSLRVFLRWPCHRCSSVLVAIRSSPAEGKLLLNRVGIVLSGRGEKARAGGQTIGQEGKL